MAKAGSVSTPRPGDRQRKVQWTGWAKAQDCQEDTGPLRLTRAQCFRNSHFPVKSSRSLPRGEGKEATEKETRFTPRCMLGTAAGTTLPQSSATRPTHSGCMRPELTSREIRLAGIALAVTPSPLLAKVYYGRLDVFQRGLFLTRVIHRSSRPNPDSTVPINGLSGTFRLISESQSLADPLDFEID